MLGEVGGKDTVADFDTAVDKILLANNIHLQSSSVSDVDHDGVGDRTLTFTTGTQAVLLGVHDLSTCTTTIRPADRLPTRLSDSPGNIDPS